MLNTDWVHINTYRRREVVLLIYLSIKQHNNIIICLYVVYFTVQVAKINLQWGFSTRKQLLMLLEVFILLQHYYEE